jgi:hypothetical protein
MGLDGVANLEDQPIYLLVLDFMRYLHCGDPPTARKNVH